MQNHQSYILFGLLIKGLFSGNIEKKATSHFMVEMFLEKPAVYLDICNTWDCIISWERVEQIILFVDKFVGQSHNGSLFQLHFNFHLHKFVDYSLYILWIFLYYLYCGLLIYLRLRLLGYVYKTLTQLNAQYWHKMLHSLI